MLLDLPLWYQSTDSLDLLESCYLYVLGAGGHCCGVDILIHLAFFHSCRAGLYIELIRIIQIFVFAQYIYNIYIIKITFLIYKKFVLF